jgi:hypothetical protein
MADVIETSYFVWGVAYVAAHNIVTTVLYFMVSTVMGHKVATGACILKM